MGLHSLLQDSFTFTVSIFMAEELSQASIQQAIGNKLCSNLKEAALYFSKV
jgi:hypothetical protein